MSKIGIIGGSGLDDPDILEGSSETSIKPPMAILHLILKKEK